MNKSLDLVFWFYFGFCLFGVLLFVCVLDGFLGCFVFGFFFLCSLSADSRKKNQEASES